MGLALGAFGCAAAQAQTKPQGISIHHELDYKVAPASIYKVFLDAKQFAACTGSPASIEPSPGATFKLFDGLIEGRNIELLPDRRIVQAWRPASWPAGIYSIVKFEFAARGAGTHTVFDHTGFPEDERQSLDEGWTSHYFEPLHKYLNA